MSDRDDTLQEYVSDMLSLDKHILEALQRQTADENMQAMPQAYPLVQKLERMLQEQVRQLENHLNAIGGHSGGPIKQAVSAVAGVAAGLLDKTRTETVSKMLRDDYTALGLAAISYTMLHTTGLALNSRATADLALTHLKHITPAIVAISKVIPEVVVADLSKDVDGVHTTAAHQATADTQMAWEPHHTNNFA